MWRQLLADVRYRLRAIFRRSSMEDDLDAELRFHLEREAEELARQRGLSRAEAERLARVAFGGVEPTKEQARDARGTVLLEQLLQDARYACRTLRKEPAFTLTIVLLLALGIGANTATFTVMQALLFRPLPVPHPERLVIIGKPSAVGSNWNGPPQTDFVSFPLYEDVRARARALADIYATGRLDDAEVEITGKPTEAGGTPDHTEVRLVTTNYFDVLQVPAARGRTFTRSIDSRDVAPVAVISDACWRRRFARDPSAIGSAIRVNDVPLSIIGIMPHGFGDVVGSSTDMWVPIGMQPALSPRQKMLDDRHWSWLQMMGRLAPGATLAQAKTAITAIEADAIRAQLSGKDLAQFESDLREDPIEVGPGARGFSRFRRDYKAALVVLMAAVGLIVLIVCANVANLMLVRAVARTRELTVRMALGAGRRRLLRQLLTETLLLAGAGGALGVLASKPGSDLLVSLASAPMSLETGYESAVLGFAAGLTLLCGILFGLVPAFRATQVDLATALRSQGRNLIGARTRVGRFAAGKALVVVQLTLSMVLLIGAGLLIRSMQRLVTADLGFDRDQLVMVKVSTQKAGYTLARTAALEGTLPERVRGLPGVIGASTTFHGLFRGYGFMGIVPPAGGRSVLPLQVKYDAVGPGYFQAIGARLLRGREFDAHDSASSTKVLVVNQSLATGLFGQTNPIGATIRDDEDATYTIVGIVGDLREASVRDVRVQEAYIPITQTNQNGFWLAVRVSGNPAASIDMIRRAVLATDPALPLEVHAMTDLTGQSVAEDRLTMRVTTFFGIIALLLAALGLYGMTSYETSRRTGEFGLRVALGADPNSVTRRVLGESTLLSAVGLACGIPAGLAAAGLIRDQIFGLGRVDLPSLAAAVAILILTTILAAYLPARRAARVAPLDALRTE